MSKDINEQLGVWRSNEDETNVKMDPAIYKQHPEMENSTSFALQFTMYQFSGNAFMSLITAPLTTAYITMQMAVPNSSGRILNSMATDKINSNLNKTPISSNIPKHKQIKIDLMTKANNASKKAFEAPSNLKYHHTFSSISSQGLLGFYKGNLTGLIHLFATTNIKFALWPSTTFFNIQELDNVYRYAYYTLTGTLIDTCFQPLHVMQSRFILQNRTNKLFTYKSLLHAVKKHTSSNRGSEFFQGNLANLPRNLFLGGNFERNEINQEPVFWLAGMVLSGLLIYPITTVQRRLECQSEFQNMISKKYTGTLNGLKVIMKEEGVRGLYRGFFGYCMVSSISTLVAFWTMFGMLYQPDIEFNN